MSNAKTLVLDADLFGDAETLRASIAAMPSCESLEIKPNEMKPDDWNEVLALVLANDKTIVV